MITLTTSGFSGQTAAFLTIPRLNAELPVKLSEDYNKGSKSGAALLQDISYPAGGINTESAIMAHCRSEAAAMFRKIEKLEPGDGTQNLQEVLT